MTSLKSATPAGANGEGQKRKASSIEAAANTATPATAQLVAVPPNRLRVLRAAVVNAPRYVDMRGQVFGRWRVIASEPEPYSDRRHPRCWHCRCTCGTERIVDGHALRRGASISCGCAQREAASRARLRDLTGQRFGRLKVLEIAGRDRTRGILWRCVCDCGREHIVSRRLLRTGDTKSCGCLLRELAAKRLTTHGLSNTRAYRIWAAMKTRCLNPRAISYANYGGRGIGICDDWLSFENFFADTLDPPLGLSIDRIDNDGNYQPTNWRWATRAVQNANRRPPARSKKHRRQRGRRAV